MSEPTTADVPLLRVVRGTPTEEELAALVAVLAGRAAAARPVPRRPRSSWAAYWSTHRAPLAHGTGAWRASALPR